MSEARKVSRPDDPSAVASFADHPRWALLIFSMLLQMSIGGFNAVDGRVLYFLFQPGGVGRIAANQQYLLDSPLLIAFGRLIHPGTLLGVGVLCTSFVLLPVVVLVAGYKIGRVTVFQTNSLIALFCTAPVWKTLGLYLGKPDGLTVVLSLLLVWSEGPVLTVAAACFLVANHLQQGVAILMLLALIDLSHKRRALLLVAGAVSGIFFTRLLQLGLGIHQHAGRVDYLLDLWSRGQFFLSPLLIVAALGSLGGAWVFLSSQLRGFPFQLRLRYLAATAIALLLGCVAVDNSRDMFLLLFPVLAASIREPIKDRSFQPSMLMVTSMSIVGAALPDISGGAVRHSSWTGLVDRAGTLLGW